MDTALDPAKCLTPRPALRPFHWAVLGILLYVDLVVTYLSLYLNPVIGWDENVYLTNAAHLRGYDRLSYAHLRPPLFPLLLAMSGDCYRVMLAGVHTGIVLTMFCLLRRMASPAVALFGAALMVLCGDLRFFGMLVMTETLSTLLLLVLILALVHRKTLIVGVLAALLSMNHWQMLVVFPAIASTYMLTGRAKCLPRFVAGVSITIAPFAFASIIAYGNPLYPILANFALNAFGHAEHGIPKVNDIDFYWRTLPGTHAPLVAAFVVSCGVLVVQWRRFRETGAYILCLSAILLATGQLVPMHIVTPKDGRFLVPLIPLVVLAAVVLAARGARRFPWVSRLAWPALAVGVIGAMPSRNMLWEISDRVNDPMAQVIELIPSIEKFPADTLVYTDVNDLAVMSHARRNAIAVIGTDNGHFNLLSRTRVAAIDVPDGALYLTWTLGAGEVLARADGNYRGPLYLVRREHLNSKAPTDDMAFREKRGKAFIGSADPPIKRAGESRTDLLRRG